jgi:hypothetical protein
MRINVINQIKLNGEEIDLFNYQYVDENGKPVSAIFQSTAQGLKNMGSVNTRLNWTEKYGQC